MKGDNKVKEFDKQINMATRSRSDQDHHKTRSNTTSTSAATIARFENLDSTLIPSCDDENGSAYPEIIKSTSTDFKHLILTFGISLLAWPICYYMNTSFENIGQNDRPFWMMVSGFLLLAAVTVFVLFVSKVNDWMFYGFTLFAFTAVIDVIITLEFYQVIHGYMSEYLSFGETYLLSSWGNAITLFDGIGFYLMYLLMNFQLANGMSWRSTSIYWGASLLNSMIVFGIGVFCGSHSPTSCIFLNIPYILFPAVVLQRAFARQQRPPWTKRVKSTILSMLFNLFSTLILLASIWITIAKGLSSLGCKAWVIEKMVQQEKALFYDEPGPFAGLQAIVFLFYLVPLQCLSLAYQFKEIKPHFLWEVALIQAGAVLQGQFAYLVYSTDTQLPDEFQADYTNKYFWLTNIVIVLAPHLLLLQLYRHKVEKQRDYYPKSRYAVKKD